MKDKESTYQNIYFFKFNLPENRLEIQIALYIYIYNIIITQSNTSIIYFLKKNKKKTWIWIRLPYAADDWAHHGHDDANAGGPAGGDGFPRLQPFPLMGLQPPQTALTHPLTPPQWPALTSPKRTSSRSPIHSHWLHFTFHLLKKYNESYFWLIADI